MLHDLLRSRRRPRRAVTDRQHLVPLGVWHDGTSWLGTRIRERRARNGTAIRCERRSREPGQCRCEVNTAQPPPLDPAPAEQGRLLRGHRRQGASAPGVPAQPRAAGTPGPWAPTGGRARRPIALESREGVSTAAAPLPGPRGDWRPPPERGAMRLGLEANSRIRDLATSCHLCKANTG